MASNGIMGALARAQDNIEFIQFGTREMAASASAPPSAWLQAISA